MYARLQTSHAAPPLSDPARAQFVETVAGHPGFAGLYLLTEDGGQGALLTLWHTEEDAHRASERTAAQLGPRPVTLDSDAVYEVEDDWVGTAAGDVPVAAMSVHLDGPLSEEHLAAARFGGRERLAPAMAPLPGIVRVLALWQPQSRSIVVFTLATSRAALEESQRVVMATELLPGEDPELLPGADRTATYRVAELATAAEGARS
jgi:hypothetical protein